MNEITLKLDERTVSGKKTTGLRMAGIIPSVVYGGQNKPILTQSKAAETLKAIREVGRHTPLDIVIDGKKQMVIVKNIDTDPVRHSIRNVEFQIIKRDDIIATEVPIVLAGIGESIAEKAGLVILQAIESISVKAKPADLPESLELSVLNLASDQDKLTVADIKLPHGVEFADNEQDIELVIANVYEPSALQAANEAAAGVAESDVIEAEADDKSESDDKTDGSLEAGNSEAK